MTTEQMDEVDAMRAANPSMGHDATTEAVTAAPRAKRPTPQDRKPKAKKKPKAKVKTVTEKNDDGEDVPIGREITLHGVTVIVLDTALGDFQTSADLSLLGEAAEEFSAAGEKADNDLMEAAYEVVSPLMRRLVGYAGERRVLAALRRENDGKLEFEHAVEFIGDLIAAMSPNS